jgi:lipoprotein NlpI
MAIELDPKYAPAYFYRGEARAAKEDYDGAIADYGKGLEIAPKDIFAFYLRGKARQGKKDYLGAIADYSKAIEFNSASPDPFYFRNRAEVRYIVKDFNGAIADYNKILELDPKDADSYWGRGMIRFFKNDGAGAHGDFSRYLQINGPEDDNAPYAIIMGYLGLRKAGMPAEAKAFLDGWLPQVDAEAWPTEILRYLAGQSAAEQLLALADDNDKLTEAHAYIGEMQLLASNRPDALAHFQWVRDNGNKEFPEYDLALAELKRL